MGLGDDDLPLPGAMGRVPGLGQAPSIPRETQSANIYWENPKKPRRWGWKCSLPGARRLLAGAMLYSPSVVQGPASRGPGTA